ncbi:hypothetical protein Micbo1qcDRAFT_157664, partial [Microdochium bolleyi]
MLLLLLLFPGSICPGFGSGFGAIIIILPDEFAEFVRMLDVKLGLLLAEQQHGNSRVLNTRVVPALYLHTQHLPRQHTQRRLWPVPILPVPREPRRVADLMRWVAQHEHREVVPDI